MSNVNVFQMAFTQTDGSTLSDSDNINMARRDCLKVITRYFHDNPMNNQDFYGFVLPSFTTNTGMKRQNIEDFIHQAGNADVAVFYPFAAVSARYLNLFEAANTDNPTVTAVMQSYLDVLNLPLNMAEWVTHYATASTTYYVVAKAAFWRVWLLLANRLEMLSDENTPLASALQQPAHEALLTIKDIIMERLVSLVLSLTGQLRVYYAPALLMPASQGLDTDVQQQCLALNQLKEAYIKSGDSELLQHYLRKRAVAA